MLVLVCPHECCRVRLHLTQANSTQLHAPASLIMQHWSLCDLLENNDACAPKRVNWCIHTLNWGRGFHTLVASCERIFHYWENGERTKEILRLNTLTRHLLMPRNDGGATEQPSKGDTPCVQQWVRNDNGYIGVSNIDQLMVTKVYNVK